MATNADTLRAQHRASLEALLREHGWTYVETKHGRFFVNCLDSIEVDEVGVFYWITLAGRGKRVAGLAWDSLPLHLNGHTINFPNGTILEI